MAKNKKEGEETEDQKEGIEALFPEGMTSAKVRILDSPYHGPAAKGKVIECGASVAKKMVNMGWAEKVAIALLFVLVGAFAPVQAQSSNSEQSLKSIYSLNSDTVTNTATIYLSTAVRVSSSNSAMQTTTVQVNVTKISGTVGGTISLLGSLDGTNYKALNTAETQTALATITATDASNVYHWRLNGSPFLYYRVSWTGTGTMSASFTAKLVKH